MQKGFTLIELVIVLAVVLVLGRLGFLIFSKDTSYSFVSGWSNELCLSGFKFIQARKGAPVQVLDAQGHGIACK